jgi:hypothetical protein
MGCLYTGSAGEDAGMNWTIDRTREFGDNTQATARRAKDNHFLGSLLPFFVFRITMRHPARRSCPSSFASRV